MEARAIIANVDDVTRHTEAEAGPFQPPTHSDVALTAATCELHPQGVLDAMGQHGAQHNPQMADRARHYPGTFLLGAILSDSPLPSPKNNQPGHARRVLGWLLGQCLGEAAGTGTSTHLRTALLHRRSKERQAGCSKHHYPGTWCAPGSSFIYSLWGSRGQLWIFLSV